MTYVAPGVTKHVWKCVKHSWVFHFNNFEKIVELVSSGAAEREKSRSMSFASFRRGSHKNVIKVLKTDHIITEKDETDKDLEAGAGLSSPLHHHSSTKKPLDVIDETETM